MASDQTTENLHGYEFGGPIGALAITVGLPTFTYVLLLTCNDTSGCPVPSLLDSSSLTFSKLAQEIGWTGLDTIFSWRAFFMTLGYHALILLFYAILPATEVHGTELRNGGRVKYRFNVFNTCVAVLGILAAGSALQGAEFIVWTFIGRNYLALLTSNMIIAAIVATYVYINSFSFRPGRPTEPAHRELALGGTTGNCLYDWFIGRELNPSLWTPGLGYIDVKSYMETRPGLLGWLILNLSFIAEQYRNHGYISDSIILTVSAQAVYILDSFWNEPAIITQIDIITDGFGFMLAFGDLVWVPFIFSIPARYLSVHPKYLGALGSSGVVAIHLLGFYIFRASNSQKNTFRTRPEDPSVKHLAFISTETGGKILTGGWWGTSRHVNYLGDWLLSWAYCLPTGIAGYVIQQTPLLAGQADLAGERPSPGGGHKLLTGDREVVPGKAYGWGMLVTYFYLIYFAVLLVHRQRRDDAKCLRKYGRDWEEYVRRVPSRIIPGIY